MNQIPSSKKEKPIVKFSSIYRQPIDVDKVPVGCAYQFLSGVDSMRELMESVADNDDIFPDDIDWDCQAAKDTVDNFGKLLSHDYPFEERGHKSKELTTAMNLPIIGAINGNVRFDAGKDSLLIIGGDKGQNLTQVELALGKMPLHWHIDIIEPNITQNLRQTVQSYKMCRLHEGTLQEVIAAGALMHDGEPIKYDFIIHNLGLHNTCPSESSRDMYVNFIESHLKGDGVAMCTTLDIDAVRRIDDSNHGSITGDLRVLQWFPPSNRCCEGMYQIRVGNAYYIDPVLSVGAISKMFDRPTLNAQIVPARYLFRDNYGQSNGIPNYVVPKHLYNASRRPELAAMLYVEIRVRHYFTVLSPPLLGEATGAWTEIPPSQYSPNDLFDVQIDYNKGRPLIKDDLLYFEPRHTYAAFKLNGIMGSLYIRKGVALLYRCDKRMAKMCLPEYIGEDLQLQVECLESVTQFPPYTSMTYEHVVVTDVYRIGLRTPTTFGERWASITAIYMNNQALHKVFSLNNFKVLCNAEEYRALMASSMVSNADGIVLQPTIAMPGSFSNRLGSARYIKHNLTVDLTMDGKVYECEFDAFIKRNERVIVKRRRDRDKGNTHQQINILCRAIDFKAWLDHVQLVERELDISAVPNYIKFILGKTTLEEVTMLEKMRVYCARRRDYELHRIYGSLPLTMHNKLYWIHRIHACRAAVIQSLISDVRAMQEVDHIIPEDIPKWAPSPTDLLLDDGEPTTVEYCE